MMFNKTRERWRARREELKQGLETRKRFGEDLWRNFRRYTDWKGLKFDNASYSFEQVQSMWGFGTGSMGYERGKKNMLIMCVFFYAVFVWCLFYFVKSAFFLGNYISALSCLLGMCVGFSIGTVSLWRFLVFRSRKYVPFLKWFFGRT